MSGISNRSIFLVTLLVVALVGSNFVVSCLAISKVRRSAHDYVVTEESFRRAVIVATSNYFASILPAYVNSVTNEAKQSNVSPVRMKFLRDLCVWYSYSGRRWVARYKSCDFQPGDFLEDSQIIDIRQGRIYARDANGFLVIRPAAGDGVPRVPAPAPAETAPL